MNGNQDWEDWLASLKRGHEKCARCEKTLMDTLLYRYAQRTFITVFERVPVIVEYDYKLCSPCLFDMITANKQREGRNG